MSGEHVKMNINAADTRFDGGKKTSSGKTSNILFREQWKITNWNVCCLVFPQKFLFFVFVMRVELDDLFWLWPACR